MFVLSNTRIVDTILFLAVNLYNLLLIGIFLSRPLGLPRLERILGLASFALALPLAVAAVGNALAGRQWWTVVLPALLVAFLILELILDYLIEYDFRRTWVLGPYLLIFYASLMGMIGYNFLVSMSFGYITLATYFLSLAATWYSYRQVGHSRATSQANSH
jgi:hypothetical protein